jgi:predicted GIY-YIG superfamily endonuclease
MQQSSRMPVYHVYILANSTGVLYTGVTNHLDRRVAQHKQKLIPGFTKNYGIARLVYFEAYSTCEMQSPEKNRSNIGDERKNSP